MAIDLGAFPASGSGYSPKGGATSCTASPAKPSIPNAALTVSGFIRAMQQRFIERAALGSDQALLATVATLDGWETTFAEPIELTEDCAHCIVDSELEYWETAA